MHGLELIVKGPEKPAVDISVELSYIFNVPLALEYVRTILLHLFIGI
jgi:hypothetical protein